MNPVWTPIYRLTAEWVTYAWLCDPHVETRKAAGWKVEEVGHRPGSLAPHGCQDCGPEAAVVRI